MKDPRDSDDRILLNTTKTEDDQEREERNKKDAALVMIGIGVGLVAPRTDIELVLERMGIINVMDE